MASQAAAPRLANTSGMGRTHPEETFSILLALGGTAGSLTFFWLLPDFEPASGLVWTIPGWLCGAYLVLQLACLLVSATQIRTLGVIDTMVAIVPIVAGCVVVAEWWFGHASLSLFQRNAVAHFTLTSVAEFSLTVWIRFVLNRRTIAIDPA
jgi:hypothetical protein